MITANVYGASAQTSCFEVFDPEIHDPQISTQITSLHKITIIFVIMRVVYGQGQGKFSH